jgi:hypothetical protein
MSDTQQGPGWRLASDGKWYPPGRQSKAPRPAQPKRDDDRVSWITGGVIAAVFVISIIALLITKKSDTTATNSTPTPPSPHASVGPPRSTISTPPAAVPPATAALPATGLVVWSGSGSDLQRGPPFTVPSGARGWNENWTYNCGALGHPGTFITNIHTSGKARTTRDSGAHSEGMGGSGTNHYNDTGTFWINVDSKCGWTDQAETVP